ncbi:MAG: phospholipid carrier-dependent glycosyltransferase, partial [bacterium]
MPALRVGPYIPWEVILPAFTWLGLLIFAARGVGGWLLQRFGRLDLSRAEEWVFSLGLGGGVIAYATLTAAVAGGLYRWPARLAVLALAAWGVSRWWRRRSLGEVRKLDEVRFPRLPMVLALLAWGVNLLGVLGPETFYDSLLYHLGVPQWYVNVHRMAPTPHMIFAPLPFMQEMLYTLALLLQGDTLAKLVSWGAGVGLTLATAALGRQLGHPKAGAWAAALVATTPAVLFCGRVTGTEIGLSVWSLLALWAVLRYRDPVSAWLVLAGVFGGLAMGTKHLGLFVCAVLGLMMVLTARQLRAGLLFAGVVAVVFLPWPIRTALLTGGNPVYPFFASTLSPGALPPDWLGLGAENPRFSAYIRSWRDYAVHPWILTMKGEESPHHLGPWALALAPLALAALRRRRQPETALAAFALGYYACWASVTTYGRFLLPA